MADIAEGTEAKKSLRESGIFLCVFLIVFSLTSLACTPKAPTHTPGTLIVHRGDASVGQGNSLPGIMSAIARGVRAIEIDIRRSSDGVPFLYHDSRIRVGNSSASPAMVGMLPEGLASHDLHLLCLPSDPPPCPLPFATLIENIRNYKGLLFLDIKRSTRELVESILAIGTRHGMIEHFVVQCGSRECVTLMREKYPSVKLLSRLPKGVEEEKLLALRPEYIQLDPEQLQDKVITRVKESGAKIVVKSIPPAPDTPSYRAELFSRGADLILTDAVIFPVLRQKHWVD